MAKKTEWKVEDLVVARTPDGALCVNADKEVKYFKGMKILPNGKCHPDDYEFARWVSTLERVEEYKPSSSPKIKLGDGTIVKLSNKFFTEEEKRLKKEYVDEHKGSGGSSGSSGGKKGSKEAYEGLQEILSYGDYKIPKAVREKLEALAEKVKPVDPAKEKAKKLLGKLSKEDLLELLGTME